MEDDVEKRHLAASERQKMKRLEAASPRREATSCRFVRINENIKIAYCLERKPVKHLNLRIRRDGSVYVSANMDVFAAGIFFFKLFSELCICPADDRKVAVGREPAGKLA